MLHDGIRNGSATSRIVTYQIAPTAPQDDAHTFLLAMGYQSCEVDIGAESVHQRLLATPTLVDDDVFYMVTGSKVYII